MPTHILVRTVVLSCFVSAFLMCALAHGIERTTQTLARGLAFPEGPVLSRDGRSVYFVNVQSSAVSRFDLKRKTLTVAWVTLPNGGRGNGATLGPDGNLYIADSGRKLIARVSLKNGQVSTVVDRDDQGRPFHSTNDVVFDRHGGLYFTDPGNFAKDTTDGAVYYLPPGAHQVRKVADGLAFPNGLALSSNGLTLYVAETPLGQIDAIDLTPNGIVPPGHRRVFAHVGGATGPDGMRLARDGSLYVAIFGDGVVAQVSPSGQILRRLPVGGKNPTNLCFARGGKSLYVTETETNTLVQVPL